MKNIMLFLFAVLFCLACDSGKRDITVDADHPSVDGDTIIVEDSDTFLPEGLPDLSEAEGPDSDAIIPNDGDELPTDTDLIVTGDCLETGEGCEPTEICLYDWSQQAYFCEDACDPAIVDSCPDGMVCEAVDGDTNHGCFLPAFISGRVFDLGDEMTHPSIEGALVSGMDSKNGAATEVSVTDVNGKYSLQISLTRIRNGTPVTGEAYTLRATAKDYEPYPGSIRVALPILLDTFTRMNDGYYVASGFLDIGLLPLPDEEKGGFTVSGTISEAMSGVLIIARCAAAPCPYTYTGKDGEFVIYNVLPGDYDMAALKNDLNFIPVAISVVDADITDLLLELVADPDLGSITGQVNIVNSGGGGLTTSVVLMAEETFIPGFDKGEIVPGLRAPESPEPPTIDGAYTIAGIPAGRYVVLAAFENDWLVRDPDPNIGGTQIVHLEIPDAGANWDITLDNFKVTRAIDIVSPGALGPELVEGNPVFIWKDDSSETDYTIKLYNAYGEVVWEKTVPREMGVDEISLTYDGDKLSGYYQWRVISLKSGAPISTSEDLKGIFYVGMPW